SLRICSRGTGVKTGVGLVLAALGITVWRTVPENSFAETGRRLFSGHLPTDYAAGVGAQVHLPTCKTLMHLFKTVAASPQAALHRMSSTGKPNLQEWTDAIQDWKWGLSKSQISGMFHGIDSAMDGQVDIQELLQCFRHGEYEGHFWQTASPKPAAASVQVVQGHHQYNCYDGLDMWRFDWSNEKKVSCSLISASELRGSLIPGLTPFQVVQRLDTDGDGVVSRNEWLGAATGFASQTPFAKTLIEPRAEFAFKSMDVSQDGNLNPRDLANSLGLRDDKSPLELGSSGLPSVSATGLKQRVLARWSTLSNAFQKMDRDHNHRLSREEFGAGLAEVRPPIDQPSELARLFQGIDALRDDRITPPEWHGTMQSETLFQSPEALQHLLHTGSAGGPDGWIHTSPEPAESLQGGSPTPQGSQKSAQVKGSSSGGLQDLTSHLEELSAQAEGKFRQKAVEWAGSMKNACIRMGVLRDDISQSAFQSAVGGFEPLLAEQSSSEIFKQMDEDKNGLISGEECVLSEEELRKKLASVKSLRNLFRDADVDSDGQLSRDEFAKLGKLLSKGSSGGKYAAFFDDMAAAGKPPLTLAALESMAGAPSSSKQVLSKEDGAKYTLPAIIHGKCILSVKGDNLPSGLSDKVGQSLSTTLSQQLGVTVRVAGAQEQQGTTSTEFDVLYTSKTQNGAEVISKLRMSADIIQTELQRAVEAVVSASASAWCSSTMDFYGPKAGALPRGQKVMQEFGQLAGKPKENGFPYVAAR
ncbi:erg10, partial [Symbiodinium pilosum]